MNKKSLQKNLENRGIANNIDQINALESLISITLETNEKFNLTAIKDVEQFREKMIFDSALGLVDNDFSDKEIIDIGTGAGFPALVLKILQPEMKLSILDATKKKVDYIQDLSNKNGWNINCINDRVESFSSKNREKFDYATARAVASLPILLETIMPLLRVGGIFIAYKGKEYSEEILASQNALKKLDCHLQKVYVDVLPDSKEERALIYIVKDKETNKKYPRDYGTIKSKSL